MKNKKGEMYIDTVISIIIMTAILYIIINLFSVLYTYETINDISNNLVTYMSARGEITSSEVSERYEELLDAYDIKPESIVLSYDNSQMEPGTEANIQYGNLIKITLQYTKKIGYLNDDGFIDVPIRITKVATSQNYWKAAP